jgi:hypothetical protein
MSHGLRSLFAGLALLMTAGGALAETLHHELEMQLDPAEGRLHLRDRITSEGLSTLYLEPAPGLEIEFLSIDGAPAADAFEAGRITLPDGGAHTLEIVLAGMIEPGPPDGLGPMLDVSGGFLAYGIGWLASGSENQAMTYRLEVSTPLPYRAVATGRVVEEEETGGDYRAVFQAYQPTEPPSLFADAYRIEEREHKGLRLRTYFPEDKVSLAPRYLDQTAGYIDHFQAIIGDYPYAGFAVVAAPLPVGMGFPGLTYVSDRILGMPFMQTRSLAHEILHNWWANGVFLDPAEGNWAEGLTTYMADYGLEAVVGGDAAAVMRLGWLRDFAALPAERDRPVASFRGKGHDADQVVGYNKTAMIFHMLELRLGRERFVAGLRDFWAKHRFAAAGWSDLQASFETASGENLDAFFAAWLERTGAPRLQLDGIEVAEAGDGYALALELRQEEPAYPLDLPLRIETEAGDLMETVAFGEATAEVVIETPSRPLGVALDPDHDLFRHLAPGEAPPILRDVTLNGATLTVLAADGEAAALAEDLAGRTLDTGVRTVAAADAGLDEAPVMLVGLSDEIEAPLAALGLELPAALQGRGTARCWVARREQGRPPVMVVAADDAEALAALLRPLPHYGRSSYLLFEGATMIEQGTWPAGESALVRRIE